MEEGEKRQKRREMFTHHVHGKYLRLALNSCYIFNVKNKFRSAMVWLVEWRWFERAIIFLILLNSIFLGVMDYMNPTADTWRNHIVIISEPVFTCIFTLEATTKIIAMGFLF